jgi:hypothetical protein
MTTSNLSKHIVRSSVQELAGSLRATSINCSHSHEVGPIHLKASFWCKSDFSFVFCMPPEFKSCRYYNSCELGQDADSPVLDTHLRCPLTLSSPRFREGTSKSTAWPQGMSTLSAVEGFNPGTRPVGQVLALLHRNQPGEGIGFG